MALPIAPTPVLKGKDAENFLKIINDKSRWGTLPLVTTNIDFKRLQKELLERK